jgi:hypothetical protein
MRRLQNAIDKHSPGYYDIPDPCDNSRDAGGDTFHSLLEREARKKTQ